MLLIRDHPRAADTFSRLAWWTTIAFSLWLHGPILHYLLGALIFTPVGWMYAIHIGWLIGASTGRTTS